MGLRSRSVFLRTSLAVDSLSAPGLPRFPENVLSAHLRPHNTGHALLRPAPAASRFSPRCPGAAHRTGALAPSPAKLPVAVARLRHCSKLLHFAFRLGADRRRGHANHHSPLNAHVGVKINSPLPCMHREGGQGHSYLLLWLLALLGRKTCLIPRRDCQCRGARRRRTVRRRGRRRSGWNCRRGPRPSPLPRLTATWRF